MTKFTKAQIKALKSVYDRCPIDQYNRRIEPRYIQNSEYYLGTPTYCYPGAISYNTFRRSASRAFGNCLMVPWCGMMLGIETDGYTHS